MHARVNGVDLHFEVMGSGTPMFVVGLLECELYQRLFPQSMMEQFQLIYVELRGSGRSGGDPSSVSFANIAADLDALSAELGLERVAVLGHAIHGLFAAYYGLRHPGTVSHVVLASTPAVVPDDSVEEFWRTDASPERHAAFERQLWSLPADVFDQESASSEAFTRYRATVTADTWYQPDVDARWLWEGITAPPALTDHLYGTLAPGWDAATVLREIDVPVFVALGRWDYRVPYLSWLRGVADLPGVTVHVFDQSAHWIPLEEPDEFAAKIAEFAGANLRVSSGCSESGGA